MISLFRRIRQRLIDSGSVSKYLFYAIGEILLVVIGILIALQINNWNEERKLDQTTEVILKQIQLDILSNIDEVESAKRTYNYRDSVFWALKQMEWTAADFRGEEGYIRRRAIDTYNILKLTNKGFEALKEHPGVQPGEYSELIDQLTALEDGIYGFDKANETILEKRDIHFDFRKVTFDWYADQFLTGTISEDQLEFYASHPRVKNYMALYTVNMRQALLYGDDYTINAIETYHTIADLLGQKENELPEEIRNYYVDLPTDSLIKFTGTYELSYAPPLNTETEAAQYDSIRIDFDDEKNVILNIYEVGELYRNELAVRSANLLQDFNNRKLTYFSLTDEGDLSVKKVIGLPHIFKKVRN